MKTKIPFWRYKKAQAGLVIRFWISIALVLLSGCILQGPWDYTPDQAVIFRGLWVNAIILADRPVTDVCIEKLLGFEEEYTNAYTFHTSAQVSIEGVFNGSNQTITLSRDPVRVNCFMDNGGRLPSAGESYNLTAQIGWDSAGTNITSQISGQAIIPQFFFVHDTARAPALALTGLAVDTSTDTSLGEGIAAYSELLNSLPVQAQTDLQQRYADTLAVLFLMGNDALTAFLEQEMPAIMEIIQKYKVTYVNGDSLFFLTGPAYFTLSHLFRASASEDVAGVQVTQRLTNTQGALGSGLGPIFGAFEPDTADYYYGGDTRSMMMFPAIRATDGFSLLDSMPIPNPAFFLGSNRFYFYGFEQSYVDYQQTEVEGSQDPRTKPKYNVSGAAGFFAGGIVDSFEVFIKADPQTDIYPREALRSAYCRDESRRTGESRWESDRQCRAYYPEYCESVYWKDESCIPDLYSKSFELNVDLAVLLDSLKVIDSLKMLENLIAADSVDSVKVVEASFTLCQGDSNCALPKIDSVLALDTLSPKGKLDSMGVRDSLGFAASVFEESREEGLTRYCVFNNYPVGVCDAVKDACDETIASNDCKTTLWQFCLDNRWLPPQCQLGMVSYCMEPTRYAPVLCKNADAYCDANLSEHLCNLYKNGAHTGM